MIFMENAHIYNIRLGKISKLRNTYLLLSVEGISAISPYAVYYATCWDQANVHNTDIDMEASVDCTNILTNH
jgi:hypothetical protein